MKSRKAQLWLKKDFEQQRHEDAKGGQNPISDFKKDGRDE